MNTCVYTAVFGSYDRLVEPEQAFRDEADFICFTDDAALVSHGWDVRVVSPSFPLDPVRSARMLKILGHPDLSDYATTLYVDASVRLKTSPKSMLNVWLPEGAELALPVHSYRDQLLDEFDEVVRLGADDRGRIYEQLMHYDQTYPLVLSMKPLWTAILARRHTPAVAECMRIWADHVLRYSRRDQLSILVALRESGLPYRAIDIDNFGSEWHEWPVIGHRRIHLGKEATYPAGPVLAELRRSRRDVEELESEVARLNPQLAEVEHAVLDLKTQIEQGTAERARLETRLASLTSLRGALVNLRSAATRRARAAMGPRIDSTP